MNEGMNPSQREIFLATPAPVSHRTAEENLGLGYLAASLRERNYPVTVIDGWLAGLKSHQIAEQILQTTEQPLFVGFACYRANMEKALEVGAILRASGKNIPLVAGGFGPTFHPDTFLESGFDIVVRGEGEVTILELAEHFKNGSPMLVEIQGISYKTDTNIVHNVARPLTRNLDSIPFPERDTLELSLKRKSPLHILTSRGCQAHCVFCSIVAFQRLSEGPQWRQRSVTNFVDELDILSRQGVRHFKVIDDSLIEPPRDEKWCAALADEIEGRGLKVWLRSSIRADRVTDGVLRELSRAGFFSFSCGIENGSASGLKRMGKSATLEDNHRALKLFEKYGIYVQGGHILFDHGTTMQELEENYDFMREYIWTISKGVFTEMYAAEGTPFTRLLQKRNILEVDQAGLGNHKYPVQDEDARKAYYALKHWHKSHMRVYDMAIDPLSAPKALDPAELRLFHPIAIELRRLDLDYMRKVLDLIHAGYTQEQIMEFTSVEIARMQQVYTAIEQQVLITNNRVGLVYDAELNPFVC